MNNLFIVNALTFTIFKKPLNHFISGASHFIPIFTEKGQASVLEASLGAHRSSVADPELLWHKE